MWASARLIHGLRVFSALRHRNFRLYWTGLLLSAGGFQMLTLAQAWLIYDLTGRARDLGFLGLAMAIPTIALNLFGGAAADRLDQRKLIMASQGGAALFLAILATLVILDLVQVWQILTIAFLTGAVHAFDGPARRSLFPHLIERRELSNAVALTSFVWESTHIVGPTLAGVLIASSGWAATGYVIGACFLGMVLATLAIHVPPIPRSRGNNVLQDMIEGMHFVGHNSVFALLIALALFTGFFGMSYVLLLPIMAGDILGVGARGLGFLMGATGVGSILMLLVVAAMRDSRYQGFLVLGGAALFGVLVLLFAFSRSYTLSLLLLFLAGGSLSLSKVLIQIILQGQVPDHLRGRVMGIYGITFSLTPLGGGMAGFVAEWMGAPFAVGLGGVVLAAFVLLVAVGSPAIRHLGRPEAGLVPEPSRARRGPA